MKRTFRQALLLFVRSGHKKPVQKFSTVNTMPYQCYFLFCNLFFQEPAL